MSSPSLPSEVDEGMATRAEDSKAVVEADVDRCGLDALRVERIDPDAAGIDRRADVTIGEDHSDRVCRAWAHQVRAPPRGARATCARAPRRPAAANASRPTAPGWRAPP